MSSSVDLASLVAQAREALAARRLDSAIEAAGRALKVEPRCVDAYLMRAEAYRRTDKYERALADLAVAVRLAPDRPGPYIVRAEILKRRNVFDQAIADATHALILDPLNASAFSIRAQCRHALGDREGAADDVRAMLDVDPTRAVPDLPAVASPSSPAAILDERFWKEPGDGRRPDDPTLFADGKPVDRTYRSRRTVADEDAPEELGTASGYRPEVVLASLPRTRAVRRRPLSRNGGLATLTFGVLLGAAGVFWALDRTPPTGVPAAPKVVASPPDAGVISESPPVGSVDETPSPLEGIWLASTEVAGGERTGEEEMRPRRKTLKVAGDTFELSESSYKLIGRIKPAPDDGADAVDFDGRYVAGGDGRGLKLRGVFKVDGDDLVLCYSYSYDDGVQVDRPKTFEALTGRNPICVDFKRVDAGTAIAPRAAPAPVPETKLDLLASIDPEKDSAGATWARTEGGLVSPDGGSVIKIRRRPPDEYRLTVRLLKGSEQMVGIGLVAPPSNVLITIDSHPDGGCSSKFDVDIVQRKGITFHQGSRLLPMHETSTVACTVRRGSIVVEVDGNQVGRWDGDFGRLAVHPDWALGGEGLFVASVGEGTVLRGIEIEPLDGPADPRRAVGVEPRLDERRADAVAEKQAPPPARTVSKTIDLSIGADGSGEFLAGDRDGGRDGSADATRPVASGLKIEGLKDAEVERLADGRHRIVHDFRKVREFVSAATLSSPAGRLEVDPRQGSLVLTPVRAPNENFKLARFEYPRQLQLPLTIRCTIEDFLVDGLVGVNVHWPSSVFAVNLQGRADDGASPRSQEGSWRLDRSRPDEWNGMFDPHDAERPGAKQLFRLPLTGAHVEDRIAPAIGVRTAVESKGVLKIRRIEVVARIVGRLGVGFDQRDGKVVVKQVLEGAGARAGVRPGDVVAKLDSREPGSLQDVMRLLSAVSVGDTIGLTVLRDGKPTELHMVAE